MTTISVREAGVRSGLPETLIRTNAALGYFRTVDGGFDLRIDQDSFDQYLANQQPPENEQQEMIIRKKEVKTMRENVLAPNGKEIDKIDRYDWTIRGKWGTPMDIPKEMIDVDYYYQRPQTVSKVRGIQSDFNRVSFGRLMVSFRDGKYYAFDGGHRHAATLNRSDIKTIPCDVYIFDSIEEEARAFDEVNNHRKPMEIIHKYRAGLAQGDRDALYIQSILKRNGIELTRSLKGDKSFKSIGLCYRMVRESPGCFENTMDLVAELCEKAPIHEQLVGGLFYLSKTLTTDITNPRLRKRILLIGAPALLKATRRASEYYIKGGNKVWAEGMLKTINSGLRNKFEFKEGSF